MAELFEIRDGAASVGSFSGDLIRQMAADGRLHSRMEIRRLPSGEWAPISNVRGLRFKTPNPLGPDTSEMADQQGDTSDSYSKKKSKSDKRRKLLATSLRRNWTLLVALGASAAVGAVTSGVYFAWLKRESASAAATSAAASVAKNAANENQSPSGKATHKPKSPSTISPEQDSPGAKAGAVASADFPKKGSAEGVSRNAPEAPEPTHFQDSIDASNENVTEGIHRELKLWENEVQILARREVGEFEPDTSLSAPIAEGSEILKLSGELKELESEIIEVEKRIEANRDKSSAAWKKLIAKDEGRLSDLRARQRATNSKIDELQLRVKAERARRASLADEIGRKNRLRMEEYERRVAGAAKVLRYDESKAFFLKYGEMEPGQFGRLLPVDTESLKELNERTRLRTSRGVQCIMDEFLGTPRIWLADSQILAMCEVFGPGIGRDRKNVRILQVVDEANVIAVPLISGSINPRTFWIMMKSEGLTDDSPVLLKGVFLVVGTKTYKTVSGVSRTIPFLIKTDLKSIFRHVENPRGAPP